MTIAIASGKGGAGKTSLVAAITATLRPLCVVADCDVDAANGPIALGARQLEDEPYFAGPGFRIGEALCSGCGRCADACRFDAIFFDKRTSRYSIIPELCERCGSCVDRCPNEALVTYEKEAGRLCVSETRLGTLLVHAKLEPGEDTSGRLVRRVRERASAVAHGDVDIVVDAPPGIGCPVIASLSGCDLVVNVVEASVSGIKDAERLIHLVESMPKKAIAVINKTGLDATIDARARALISTAGVPLAGHIPFDPILRSMEERGKTWANADKEAGAAVREAVSAIEGVMIGLSHRRATNES